ncbi:peptide chain release factor 1 [Peptoanaerobacter stomatis]|uniref:Peptide chain release factor 1 n=2 Tax=Peptoanaerobacter stomatis TaxID=796937 RepID=J5WLL0_9FIRM|nr:peptide chain release factor 1 [Peptoanaerobacter stomatis]EHL14850.1 peptide chain release factor 1 [Peptoanaerobacter stomatis]EJU22857.1 peptide chain release factor 1 [Peptoanaerobacter stomatis]NWO25539.1 peptide chain release factor 1 [Peptostreptococcaceae bacterium oral taxon 081]
MFENLSSLKDKYADLEIKIADPEIINNQEQWQKLMKEHAELSPVVSKYNEYVKATEDIKGAKDIIANETDEDLRDLAKEELSDLEENLEKVIEELKILLLPKDPNDDKNVIVEIRGGAGGEEAALFAGVLFRMYSMYASNRRWKVELMSSNETGIGGYKEVIFMISGKGAYSRLKFESGVHRVQRVPETESQGRIHTSTVTVAVLPEAEDVEVNLDLNDVRVDVFRSSGNGGQSVNTTDSAVRLTHIPTGIVISMQDEKSQLKNKEKAFKILKAKLYDMELEKAQKEMASQRKSQVGTGDRAERIRTYNYPQGRVSDHRIGLNLYKLEAFLNGDLDEVIDALITTAQAENLNSLENI